MVQVKYIERDETELGTIKRDWYEVTEASETDAVSVGDRYAVCSDGSVLDVDGMPLERAPAERALLRAIEDGPVVMITVVNPWTHAQVEHDVSALTQTQLDVYAQLIDGELRESINDTMGDDCTPAQWLAEYVKRVGPEPAGVIIIGG